MPRNWFKPLGFLMLVFLVMWWLPEGTVDPWGVFSPKQVAKVIFALAFIQAVGAFAIRRFGSRLGARLTGFLGGLVSSTATTVLVSRRSHELTPREITLGAVTILSAMVGMMVEVGAIIWVGTDQHSLLLILVGPVLATEMIVFFLLRDLKPSGLKTDGHEFKVLPILKLAVFIVAILAVSKAAQAAFGESGLYVLTFLLSLFEMHASIVANIGLFEADVFSIQSLALLLMLSGFASYLSKLFLVVTLGSPALRRATLKYFLVLILSLLVSWAVFLTTI